MGLSVAQTGEGKNSNKPTNTIPQREGISKAKYFRRRESIKKIWSWEWDQLDATHCKFSPR
jgi:hypothetical protein